MWSRRKDIMKYKSNKLRNLEKNRFSVFYEDLSCCCHCGSTYQITKHEVFEGRNRRNSMIYGFVLPLCLRCHRDLQEDKEFNNKWKQASDVIANGVKNFGDKVVNMAGGVGNLSKIDGGLRGTPLHQIIYKTGKKFGHKFYGKGAVKLTSKIGKTANYLSKGIGPALQLISLGVEIGSKVQQEQQIKKIQDTKRDTFNKFSSLASDIISNIEEQFKTYEVEVFDEKTNEIENIRKSLIENNRNNSDYINKLKKYREDLCILTEEISKA